MNALAEIVHTIIDTTLYGTEVMVDSLAVINERGKDGAYSKDLVNALRAVYRVTKESMSEDDSDALKRLEQRKVDALVAVGQAMQGTWQAPEQKFITLVIPTDHWQHSIELGAVVSEGHDDWDITFENGEVWGFPTEMEALKAILTEAGVPFEIKA